MARESIDSELAVIQSSKYGKDMRVAIHDAFEKVDGNEQIDANSLISINQNIDQLGGNLGALLNSLEPNNEFGPRNLGTYHNKLAGELRVCYIGYGFVQYSLKIKLTSSLEFGDSYDVSIPITDPSEGVYPLGMRVVPALQISDGAQMLGDVYFKQTDNVIGLSIIPRYNTTSGLVEFYIDGLEGMAVDKFYYYTGTYRNTLNGEQSTVDQTT